MSRSSHTDRVVCQNCKHENTIDSSLNPNSQPLQDWFCAKCDQKLFSVTFKNPAHPDTVPITCQQCKARTNLYFDPKAKANQFVKWTCKDCGAEIIKLKILKSAANKEAWSFIQNSSTAKSVTSSVNQTLHKLKKFSRKDWIILGVIAVSLLYWLDINSGGSQSPIKKTNYGTVNSQQNVYRGTRVAKQEFYKYSKTERVRIQKFFKDNFGYKSTIDGLWGPQTSESFIRAANRYVNGKSLHSENNVNIVYANALSKQSTGQPIQSKTRVQNNWQNNLGLNNDQAKTYRYLANMCSSATLGRGAEAFAQCTRNAFCQAKFGRNCETERPQINCIFKPHPLQGTSIINYPYRLVCK